MKLYAVALITWAAFTTASSEHNIANLNDEKAVDYTKFRDSPIKQIAQPYLTGVKARSSGQTGTEDHSDDFANAGLSRSAVHADKERGSNDVSTTDSSSPGSIYATPLTETSIRLETTDEYPFKEYPSHEPGYTVSDDEFLVENAGSFGQRVRQDHLRDGTIVRTVIQIGEGRNDEYPSFQKSFSSTVSPLKNEDDRGSAYTSATRELFVLALKKESNLAHNSSPDDSNVIKSKTSARNPDASLAANSTAENSPPGNIVSILENDVISEILPTPQARLSQTHNDTADEEATKKSMESTKKSESVVRTSTTVEISPSLQVRFSGPIIVPDLPERETQEMVVDYIDASEAFRPIENAGIAPETNAKGFRVAASSSLTTSSIMLNPLQVGITLVNANEADLRNNNEQSVAMDTEDYPQDDQQRLATVDKEFVKNNQSRTDYQDESFERIEVEKHAEIVTQKVPDNSVEIQKSIEIYHTAPVHEIHYPPEYIQQTTNLGVIETNNIGSLQRSKQPYDQVEQSELRPTYDIYQGNDQDEKSVIKAHASTLSQKLNRHEYNALEDDVGRPIASAVGAEYSSSIHEQIPFELQPFRYNDVQSVPLAPNQIDDTLYDQSNVRHNFNGNNNDMSQRAKPAGSSTRQKTTNEPVKPYVSVPSTYQYSVQQPQSNQPYDHQQPFQSSEIRRPEAPQLLLKIIPAGSSADGGFLVPIPRPYPFEKTVHVPHPIEIEKKIPVGRLVEKKVQLQVPVPVPVPQPYPVHVQVPVEVEKQIRVPHIYPIHIERVIEKNVPYTVQRLVVQPPSYPLRVRLPAAYPAYAAATIERPGQAAVPTEKTTEKPSSRPPRPYRADADRPTDNSGTIETRFTKYYQRPHEPIFAGESADLHGIAGGLAFVPQPQNLTNASQFYGNPYGRPSAYDYNIDIGKNYVPTAHFSNVKLMILPKKFGGHVILRPHATASSYAIPSFGRQVVYNLVEKDKAVKNQYVGPVPPRKTSQSKAFIQAKSPQFSTSNQSLTIPRKSRQPETQSHGNFRQSKMEYGFKPPMVPSIQYDEKTASKVEN